MHRECQTYETFDDNKGDRKANNDKQYNGQKKNKRKIIYKMLNKKLTIELHHPHLKLGYDISTNVKQHTLHLRLPLSRKVSFLFNIFFL